jgi:hypothetical protein
MHCQFRIFAQLVVALIFAVIAQADYIMDDRNSTIQYAGSWYQVYAAAYNLDLSKVFNDTV